VWLIPSNHPLYFHFAPAFLASKEDLKELSGRPVSWPTWKSKHSSLPTYLRAWKRVWWIAPLFGRMLKPSQHNTFITKYTASLVDIRANLSALPETDKAPQTLDTFGRIYKEASKQLNLFGAFSKMSMTTLTWDLTTYTSSFAIWVSQLRQEYTVRVKRAHHTSANDYLFWPSPMSQDFGGSNREDFSPKLSVVAKQWSTPRVSGQENAETRLARGKDLGLLGQVQTHSKKVNWPTPDTLMDHNVNQNGNRKNAPKNFVEALTWPTPDASMRGSRVNQNGHQITLQDAIKKCPTPAATDYKGVGINDTGRDRLDYAVEKKTKSGQLVQANHKNIGKPRAQLNPAWVAQLMGTTSEKIFFVPLAIAWWSNPQPLPLPT